MDGPTSLVQSVCQHPWCSWWEHIRLHNKHLNRICKEEVKALGPNKTVEDVTRAGKALGVIIVPILRQFDLDNNAAVPSGKHSLVSAECDAIVSELIKWCF